MPSITLTITNPQNDSSEQLLSKIFEGQGGTLGRSLSNDWVLHDVSRFISSQHAAISYQDNEFYITDLSSNGVYIDNADTPLGKGNTASLNEAHSLCIGEFILTVTLQSSNSSDEDAAFKTDSVEITTPPFFEPPVDRSQEEAPLKPDDFLTDYGNRDPLALLDAQSSASLPDAHFHLPENLFEEGVSSNQPIPAHEYSPASQIEDAFIPSDVRPETAMDSHSIPENWDQTHFGTVNIDPAREANTIPPKAEPIAKSESPSTIPPSTPSLTSTPEITARPASTPQQAPVPVPLPEFIHQPFQQSGSSPEKHPLPPSATPASLQNQTPAQASTPAQTPTSTSTSTPAPAPTQAQTRPEEFSLAKAAFEANGLDPSLLQDPHFVDQSLALIPEMLKGLMATLKSRAEIKNELRASRTILQSTENNPIKFSVSLQDAVNNLIAQQRPGFLNPIDSVQQAFEDLTEHEAALIAGIQSGLTGVLNKLSPEKIQSQLERQQGNKKLFGKLSPGKKWQQYEQTYQSVTEESNNSFIDMFGEEFLEGYESFITHHKRNGN